MPCINFKTFEEYLRELERVQTDRQTNRMHKHFLTLVESVKKRKFSDLAQNLQVISTALVPVSTEIFSFVLLLVQTADVLMLMYLKFNFVGTTSVNPSSTAWLNFKYAYHFFSIVLVSGQKFTFALLPASRSSKLFLVGHFSSIFTLEN